MKNKKTILLIIGILLSIIFLAGISYAYYIKSINQEESNVVKTKCLNFSLTNEKNDIKLDEQYPIPDSEGRKLTPYQFTITNACEQFISYNVNLEFLETTTMDSSAVKVMINNEAPVNLSTLESTSVSINTSKDSKILATGSLGSNDSVDYALRLWMDYGDSADTSSMNKVFESKIVVTATVGTYKPSDYVTTLHDAILVNEYGVKNVDNAIKRIEEKETPDFSKSAPTIIWQQKEETTINNTINKLAPNAINSDDYSNKLGKDEYKIRLCTIFTYDSQRGVYKLDNCNLLDPTIIDFSSSKYYYITESIGYNISDKKIYVSYAYDSTTIYQVQKVKREESTITLNSNNYDSYLYTLTSIPFSSEELESDNSDKGLYVDEDDYGKTYYYRGNVKNNNVYFAGYYWQIVRINGDNSIRLIYNGATNTSSGVNQSINNRNYQFNNSNDKIAYVGYMYGNPSGTTFDEIHANLNSSVAKKNLDE